MGFARRAVAAVVAGVGVVAIGLTSFDPSFAAGRSGIDSPLSLFSPSGRSASVESFVATSSPASSKHKTVVAGGQSLPAGSVCVRLCDGYFFPASGSGTLGAQASCASQCPGAPTRLFFRPSGSDRIEDATALNGQRYTALPGAFRYRTTVDKACACGGPRESVVALLQDETLRRGDFIMTADGVRMFRGARRVPYAMNDFTGLANASMPRTMRATLTAMEHASVRLRPIAPTRRIETAQRVESAKSRRWVSLR